MNKQLDKKIERLEGLKEKEKEKINSINRGVWLLFLKFFVLV